MTSGRRMMAAALCWVLVSIYSVCPLPAGVSALRPDGLLLFLLGWHLVAVTVPPLGVFLLGLWADLLLGTPLGIHAFLYSGISALFLPYRQQFLALSLWAQVLGVWVIAFLSLFVQDRMMLALGVLSAVHYVGISVSTALCSIIPAKLYKRLQLAVLRYY